MEIYNWSSNCCVESFMGLNRWEREKKKTLQNCTEKYCSRIKMKCHLCQEVIKEAMTHRLFPAVNPMRLNAKQKEKAIIRTEWKCNFLCFFRCELFVSRTIYRMLHKPAKCQPARLTCGTSLCVLRPHWLIKCMQTLSITVSKWHSLEHFFSNWWIQISTQISTVLLVTVIEGEGSHICSMRQDL